jgi:pyruvate/2-oxoglutarate/acetoin dehydrogenase E1 component
MRSIAYNQAIAGQVAGEMERDLDVVLWGLDIGSYGGERSHQGSVRALGSREGPRHAGFRVGLRGWA